MLAFVPLCLVALDTICMMPSQSFWCISRGEIKSSNLENTFEQNSTPRPSGYLLNLPGTLICWGLWGSLTCCAVTQNVLFEFIEEITITVTRRRSPQIGDEYASRRRYDYTTIQYDVQAFKHDTNSIWGLVLGWIAGFGTRVGARATRPA